MAIQLLKKPADSEGRKKNPWGIPSLTQFSRWCSYSLRRTKSNIKKHPRMDTKKIAKKTNVISEPAKSTPAIAIVPDDLDVFRFHLFPPFLKFFL